MVSSEQRVLFPTFVVGSLPRPQWVRDLIEDTKAGRVSHEDADRLLDDAVPILPVETIFPVSREISSASRRVEFDARSKPTAASLPVRGST